MPIGPGKYDKICTLVREHAQADLAVVIVIGGKHGPGFSVQSTLDGVGALARLPEMLRSMADDIEKGYPRT